VTGTAGAGNVIDVLDGGSSLGTTTADGSGNWTFPVTSLSDGSHSLTATAADPVGNASAASSARTITVDTHGPAPTVTAPTGNTDGQPTLSGSAGTAARDSSSVTIDIHSGGSVAGPIAQTLTATVAGNGTWSAKATLLLPIGSYVARVTQTDSAGNSGSGDGPTFTVQPTIAAAGDIACPPGVARSTSACHYAATSDLLVGNGYHQVLPLGDNQYNEGTIGQYQNAYDPTWGRVKAISHPVPGNHEYISPSTTAQGYFDYFDGVGVNDGAAGPRGKGWYSFDIGTWHVIALNSNCWDATAPVSCAQGSEQELWLLSDLAAHTNQCTLAYWHHPRFTSGNAPGISDAAFMDQIWKDVVAGGVDLVLNGHAHGYERFAPMTANGTATSAAAGTREIVAATGGDDFQSYGSPKAASEVINNSTFGVLRLTLRSGAYDWQFVPEAGSSFGESGSTNCR
jgi:hypothetical protein